jgi:predicted GNAT superfamily acetyltransferase
MEITIRPVQTHAEYTAVEQIQRDAWGEGDAEIVPYHMLVAAQKGGGLVLAAFETQSDGTEQMVGFVFGFLGRAADGQIKHCSHLAGVSPTCQNRNVGYRLKLAQREYVLAQGLDLITWTFDPLESRNARLNFHKLGGVCQTYLRDLYGEMRDALNAGLPSDRFEVEWHIRSAHVADRLRDDGAGPSLGRLLAAGVPVLNRSLASGAPPRPPDAPLPLPTASDPILIQIPSRFQAIKETDMALACAWRMHTRALFETAFAADYVVVDLLYEAQESFYLLQKQWRSD